MPDLRILKKSAAVRAHLYDAAVKLPAGVREPMVEKLHAVSVTRPDDVTDEELEEWLFELEDLGRRFECRGGYWRLLEWAATGLGLPEAVRRIDLEFHNALRRLAAAQGEVSGD